MNGISPLTGGLERSSGKSAGLHPPNAYTIKRSTYKRNLIYAFLFAFLPLSAFTYWFVHFGNSTQSNASSGKLLQPEFRVLAEELLEVGIVVAKQEYPVLSPFDGEVVWMIEDGTRVEAGEIVVRFDATNLKDELEKLEQERFDRSEAVEIARQEVADTEKSSELEILELKMQMELAEIERADKYSLPYPESAKDSELTLKSAELRMQQSERIYKAHEELNKLGFVTDANLKQKRLAFAREKALHAKAQVQHRLTLLGASEDTKRQADLKLAEARLRYERAQFNRTADLEIAKAKLELAQIELDNFNLRLQQKQMELQQSEVRAKVAGRVAFVDIWKGSNESMAPLQVGDTRGRGQDLCKLVDTSTLRLETWINQADLHKLTLGQAASLQLTAFPERIYEAEVGSIDLVAKDKNIALSRLALSKSGEAFVNVVKVFLNFKALSPEEHNEIRLGFTALARIRLQPPVQVLSLPRQAIRSDEKGTFVIAGKNPGSLRKTPVKVGLSNALYFEVTSGLERDVWVELP